MFHLFKRAAADVAAASAGMIRVFVDSATNRFMAKDENGNLIDMKGDPGVNAVVVLVGGNSNAIGTGTKSFSYPTTPGLGWTIGQRLRAANGANWVEGIVTEVTSTGVTIEADLASGSGTFSSWNIGIAGQQGAVGPSGLTTGAVVVSFANKSETQVVEVIDPDVTPSNPPYGLSVQSEIDWDLSYTATVDIVEAGRFEILVIAQDTHGDPLNDIPLPSVRITYLKPVN